MKGMLATESFRFFFKLRHGILPYLHLDMGAESKKIGGRDAVFVAPVALLKLLGSHTDLPALLQQHLELSHLYLGGQTGTAVPVTYQSLQRRHVDTEGTAAKKKF